jgi:hypothetical protein
MLLLAQQRRRGPSTDFWKRGSAHTASYGVCLQKLVMDAWGDMKALVYQGRDKKELEDRPIPEIKAHGDAVVRIVKTTICGTDFHILKGDVPTCVPGRILGHEGVGDLKVIIDV